MSTAITIPADAPFLTESDKQHIRRTIARDANEAEFEYFIKIAMLRRLNPLLNQIALIIRNSDSTKRSATIQTTIHGLRLIADRTKRYAPGRAATYTYDNNGSLVNATAYVMKYHVASKTWHEVSDTAFMKEYKGTGPLWGSMPHVMLAKCAEALALRRAFPEDLSGLYTDDEMGQADLPPTVNEATGEVIDSRPVVHKPTAPQRLAPPATSTPAPTGQAKAGAVTKIQRANLIGNYCELYGCEADTATTGLHGIFQDRFGHDMDAATYNEGAVIMAHLLQLKQQAAA